MALPRFHFVSLHGPSLPGAATAPSGVLVPAPRAAGEHVLGWRLLGPNNRELGRSARESVDLDALLADVFALRARIEDLVLDTMRLPAGGWTWTLGFDSGMLARSARAFHRERECRYNAEQFHHAVPLATWHEPASVAALPVVVRRAFDSQSLLAHAPVRNVR